jgi:mono/diheme cytochrome c family protein
MKNCVPHSKTGARRTRDILSARQRRRSSPLRSFLAPVALAALAVLLAASAHSVASAQARPDAGAQSASASAKTDNAATGNAKNGKAIYTADGCYECHGREAQGGAGTGPKLGPAPIPYPAFVFQVRSPRDQMPPYTSKVLSDAELADIYAFVQSAPQPPKVDSIPQLK